MFTQNQYKAIGLTDEHIQNEYFLLYYQFIKHAFGLVYTNPKRAEHIIVSLLLDQVPASKEKFENFKDYLERLNASSAIF
jgi:hypothetical protein